MKAKLLNIEGRVAFTDWNMETKKNPLQWRIQRQIWIQKNLHYFEG